MQNITYDRNTKIFTYKYKNKDILFDNFENLYWMYDAINTKNINWKIDKNNLLYCVESNSNDDNIKKIYLIEKILKTSIIENNKKIYFNDNNIYNYCCSNIKIIDDIINDNNNNNNNDTNENFNILPENFPTNYNVIQSFKGHVVYAGKKSGQTFNPYWLVYELNDNEKKNFYVMSSNENTHYFIFSVKSLEYIKDKTWFLSQNGYITTIEKTNDNKRFQYYLHQLICKTELGEQSSTKSVDHINRNKLDNRIENLRWATQSEQNSNTDKRVRKYNAKPLPPGITQEDLPKFVVYYHEWLDKEKTRSREYFKIEKHPKQEKIWISSKSNKISIHEKLQNTIDKLKEIES